MFFSPKIILIGTTPFSCMNFEVFVKISTIASPSHLIAIMAIHWKTFETAWFLCLNLLRMFIFKAHSHPLHVPRQWYFKELNVFPSLDNMRTFLRTFVDHWRNSWILNIVLQNVFAGSPLVSLKHRFVYSPSHITMPLTFLPNSMINLEMESISRCSSSHFADRKRKRLFVRSLNHRYKIHVDLNSVSYDGSSFYIIWLSGN